MLYIKIFNNNLCCDGFVCEVGKEYNIETFGIDGLFSLYESMQNVHESFQCGTKDDYRFCYVECLSDVISDTRGIGCKHIRIVKEIVGDELNFLFGIVDGNEGLFNVGMNNIGDYNVGDCNIGIRNIGDKNTGDYNDGDKNTGDYNNGNLNTGDYNNGCRNTGFFNSCDNSNGIFCDEEPTIKIFNMDSGMTLTDFKFSKYYKAIVSTKFEISVYNGGNFKRACNNWWNSMENENREIIKSMPNFNDKVFANITGIKV